MEEVTASGLRIAYRRAGSGVPLVLLHGGFGFDSRSWQAQLDALSDSFDVVAWDAPGCGESGDPPDPFTMADYADCLAEFIAGLGLERPHVLGISFGGALALALFGDHPTVPGSLVLAGAYAGWAGSLPPEEVARRVRLISDQLRQPVDEWLPSYVAGMFSQAAPAAMRAQALALMSGVRPGGNLTMLRAMAEADLRDVLPRRRRTDAGAARRHGRPLSAAGRARAARADRRFAPRRPARRRPREQPRGGGQVQQRGPQVPRRRCPDRVRLRTAGARGRPCRAGRRSRRPRR